MTTTYITARQVSPERKAAILRAAHARGMTLSQYLDRLSQLHEAVRARADAGDDGLQAELVSLGLETVNQ